MEGTMTAGQALHKIIDDLPESDLVVATRVLGALQDTADPVLNALHKAPIDDEPDDDDFDVGLTEARTELAHGEGVAHSTVMRGEV
jgi:hypothetical protein